MNHEGLKQLIKQLIQTYVAEQETQIPIGVSNRHIHLSQQDFNSLFPGEALKMMKWLKQPGEFAAEQTVTVVGYRGQIERVRVLGPCRKETQLEISKTDAKKLGIDPHIRISGDLLNTPGIKLKTDAGEMDLKQGVIIAKRHIHMPPYVAKNLQVIDGESVSVQIKTHERPLIFQDCLIRVGDNFELEMHIDVDEANAANVGKNTFATIIKQSQV